MFPQLQSKFLKVKRQSAITASRVKSCDFTSDSPAIEGITKKRKMKLLRNLGSIERIAKATIEELKPFVGAKAATQIFEHFETILA